MQWLLKKIKERYQKYNPQLNREIFQMELGRIFAPNEDTNKSYIKYTLWIEIFPNSFWTKFNLGNFYALIVSRNSDKDINSSGDNIVTIEQCVDKLREISRRIRQKEIKKALTKYPFQLTETTIYLIIYSNIKKATKGRIFTIDTLTNKF